MVFVGRVKVSSSSSTSSSLYSCCALLLGLLLLSIRNNKYQHYVSGFSFSSSSFHSTKRISSTSSALNNNNHKNDGVFFSSSSTTTTATVIKSEEKGRFNNEESNKNKNNNENDHNDYKRTYSFEVALDKARPKPETFLAKLNELWNDPRPVTDLLQDNDNSEDGSSGGSGSTTAIEDGSTNVPYCIISDEFDIGTETFQILLYPRGRFVTGGSSNSDGDGGEERNSGPAAMYLRYLPNEYGDEVDISWHLRLVDTRRRIGGSNETILPIMSSGGLPKSNETWSAAMTFCTESEAIESFGRATDWGCSAWYGYPVCSALGHLVAQGEITIYGTPRSGQSSFSWPLGSKGAIGALIKATTESSIDNRNNNNNNISMGQEQDQQQTQQQRVFRSGEVLVPTGIWDEKENDIRGELEKLFIYPGIDYRIMNMFDKNGNVIFSTENIQCQEDRDGVQLAIRPCGWKMQQQVWKNRGMTTEWPVTVPLKLVSSRVLTRFNPGSAVPRISSSFARDWVSFALAILVAASPIPATLLARNVVSLYAIPSASMEPTLLKGDVLLVEKFPGIYGRTQRGDVVLFTPPQTLRDIIINAGGSSSAISGNSLFVKRLVGLPGDRNIALNSETNDVAIDSVPTVGPDRNLCDDEPLKLIDRFLESGKGKSISELGPNDLYVLGDCKAVSIDSRVFGVLPKENIVGKPIARIWPLDRITFTPL